MNIFHEFAKKHHGEVVSVDWCTDTSGNILPSCEGHAIVRVPSSKYDAAYKAADKINQDWHSWGSIFVQEER
jgi:hypothetical protein